MRCDKDLGMGSGKEKKYHEANIHTLQKVCPLGAIFGGNPYISQSSMFEVSRVVISSFDIKNLFALWILIALSWSNPRIEGII